MKQIKYFLQFLSILILFAIFKMMGLKLSSILSAKIFQILGPWFRSKKIVDFNLSLAFPNMSNSTKIKIRKEMWGNYGKIFAEYMFIKELRNKKFSKKIKVENQNILEEIKKELKPVNFISGHFNNFELMAMCIEKSGVQLSTIYRPLNNNFLNPLMEKIRKSYICKNQIKKGYAGTRELLKNFKKGNSIALMIDQRVSEGISCNFFGKEALTTTIPAQFVKKFNSNIVPVHIERDKNDFFKLKIYNPLKFSQSDDIKTITLKLNRILEDMIIKNPEQWIWTHNRWK